MDKIKENETVKENKSEQARITIKLKMSTED